MKTVAKAREEPAAADGGITAGARGAALADAWPTRAPARAAAGQARSVQSPHGARVLADRIAAILTQHEPGWRLPRLTALARRYNVSTHEAGKAVDELVARHLVRRLPDGQLYRSSPAEHLTPLEGITGLGTRVGPMGAELTCRSHRASWRPAPAEITQALRIPPGEPACVLQLAWTSNGEPAATATTYLAAHLARQYLPAGERATQAGCSLEPLFAPEAADGKERADCRPAAITVELQPPLPSVAKRLRLAPGHPAFLVTVRFDEVCPARPRAVTAAVLRPDMFRITLESVEPPC